MVTLTEMPYLKVDGQDFDLEFEKHVDTKLPREEIVDQVIGYLSELFKGKLLLKDRYGNMIKVGTYDDKENLLKALNSSSQFKLIVNNTFTKTEKELLDIILFQTFKS